MNSVELKGRVVPRVVSFVSIIVMCPSCRNLLPCPVLLSVFYFLMIKSFTMHRVFFFYVTASEIYG
jgi:hypothetical protein